MSIKVVLTGGGTGGHAYPAISIAHTLKKYHPYCEILYIGGKNSIEEKLALNAGIAFESLDTRKLKKLISLDSIAVIKTLVSGFFQAKKTLGKFKPDVIIGTGGYASAAVCIAGICSRIKVLIHEQNAVPGRTNIVLGKFTKKVCVTFADSKKYFPSGKTVFTGLPVRDELFDLPDRISAANTLGIDPEKFTLLVYGGSQGSVKLNQIVLESLQKLKSMSVQVIHQTGEANYTESLNKKESSGYSDYYVYPYFDDSKPAFACADIMLARCGASSIAEITAIGIPAIYVPYPFAYANHQFYNAKYIADNGGGILIEEKNLSVEALTQAIEKLMIPTNLEQMRKSSKNLGIPDAADKIVKVIDQLLLK